METTVAEVENGTFRFLHRIIKKYNKPGVNGISTWLTGQFPGPSVE